MKEAPPPAPSHLLPSHLLPSHLLPSDLRAATRLATAATAGVVDLVEAMHARIAQFALPGAAIKTRTEGITGLVYKTVRGVTEGVALSLDALLGGLVPMLSNGKPDALPTAEREAVIAALNGVLGDHLAATLNPLATTMALRHNARALVIERAALKAALPTATGRIAVFVHGLCMNDRQWLRDNHDHGSALARDGGWTPLYLHYNSGLPIATNGSTFSALMESLIAQWPRPIERVAIIGHSMGGLVARSAIHAARQSGMAWIRHLGDLVCLGTPHQGAPLERAGHGVDVLLGVSSYSAAFTQLTKLRSAGITDLRHGRVVNDGGNKTPATIRLPRGIRCHAIAGSLGRDAKDLKHRLLGDGLVPLDSALGRHSDATRALAVAKARQTVVYQTGHLDLLSSPLVYAALKKALA